MLNRWIGLGRLTRDPELRYSQQGVAVCTITIAVDRPYKNAQGQHETDFIRIKAWRKLAEVVAEHTAKGQRVAVEGRLEIRNYEDKDGNKKTSVEINADNVRFIDYKKQDGEQQQANNDDFTPPPDEDLPF